MISAARHGSPAAPTALRRTRRWPTFLVVWLLLSLFPFVPSFHGDLLVNTGPLIALYADLLAAPSRFSVGWLAWFAGHAALAAALTALVSAIRARRRNRRVIAGVVIAGVLCIGGAAWIVHVCWPDGIFFDASNVYYDVSDLVDSRTMAATSAPFASADDLATCLKQRLSHGGEHDGPDLILGCLDRPVVIAWGSWPEHYRLRRELEALRASGRRSEQAVPVGGR
jgi:hypothetical protein